MVATILVDGIRSDGAEFDRLSILTMVGVHLNRFEIPADPPRLHHRRASGSNPERTQMRRPSSSSASLLSPLRCLPLPTLNRRQRFLSPLGADACSHPSFHPTSSASGTTSAITQFGTQHNFIYGMSSPPSTERSHPFKFFAAPNRNLGMGESDSASGAGSTQTRPAL